MRHLVLGSGFTNFGFGQGEVMTNEHWEDLVTAVILVSVVIALVVAHFVFGIKV